MTRLVILLVTLTSFGLLFQLGSGKKLKVSNENFQYEKVKKAHLAKVELENRPKKQDIPVPKKEETGGAKAKFPPFALDTEELQNGYQVYMKKGKCITCHGKRGEGKKGQLAPKLAAQHDWYLYKQLKDFKAGRRINRKMQPFLRGLSDKDFADVSLYLSKLPRQ